MTQGVSGFIHYLDDFLVVGPPGIETTNRHLATAIETCGRLGFPVADHKTITASTTTTFLGIQIDSVAGTVSLPVEKLQALRNMLEAWGQRKAAPKRKLLCLLCHLSHASFVVPPGRTFVRHLITASTQASAPHHFVRLNKPCRADLAWWLEFGVSWGGVFVWPPPDPSIICFTDASGSWGCGAVLGNHPFQWFQLAWPTHWSSHHITAKELVPVVISAALWGPQWTGHQVLFRSDNQAVVAAVNSGSSRDHTMAHRCFFFSPQPGNLQCRLNTYRECRTPPRMHSRETRRPPCHCSSHKLVLIHHIYLPPYRTSSWPSTPVGRLLTGVGGSGPLCSGHCRQHHEDIRLREVMFPQILPGSQFNSPPPFRRGSLPIRDPFNPSSPPVYIN